MNKQIKETKAGHAAEQCDDLIMLSDWPPHSWLLFSTGGCFPLFLVRNVSVLHVSSLENCFPWFLIEINKVVSSVNSSWCDRFSECLGVQRKAFEVYKTLGILCGLFFPIWKSVGPGEYKNRDGFLLFLSADAWKFSLGLEACAQ